MSEKPDPEERTISRADKEYDRQNARYLVMNQLSAGFAMLAVRSAFLLNGAALFALPPVYISLSKNGGTASAADLYWPAAMFVFGIFFAGLCACVAYINYQIIGDMSEYDGHLKHLIFKELHDPESFEKEREFYTQYRAELEPIRDKYLRWAVRTARIGLFLAFVTFGCFIYGCYLSGGVLF